MITNTQENQHHKEFFKNDRKKKTKQEKNNENYMNSRSQQFDLRRKLMILGINRFSDQVLVK